jgi:hypothetical protein
MLIMASFLIIPKAFSQDIKTGLIGHWKLDETSGTTAIDYVSNKNGTMLGGMDAGADSAGGKVGTALNFDGVDDHIDIGNHPEFDLAGKDFSISFWFYADEDLNEIGDNWFNRRSIISKSVDNPGARSYQLFYQGSGDNFFFEYWDGGSWSGGASMVPGRDWLPNTWYHAVITFDQTDFNWYLNGKFDRLVTGEPPIVDASEPLRIGRFDDNDVWSWNGLIDDVRIYNRALTADDVTELYARWDGHLRYNLSVRSPEYFNGNDWIAAGTKTPSDTGLVGHWKLDEASGVFVDSSGNGNDGTQSGGVTYASTGVISYAAGFDGVDDRITVSVEPFDSTGAITMATWVKTKSNTNQTMISRWGDTPISNRAFNFATDPGTTFPLTEFWFYDDSCSTTFGIEALADNMPFDEWTHVAAVYEPSVALRLYTNGILDREITAGVPASRCAGTQPLTIGSRPNDAEGFDGALDDARIYDRALSPSEVQDLYLSGHGTGSWAQVGNDLNIAGDVVDPALTNLTYNTIAFIDQQLDELRTYSWDGSDWTQIGNSLSIPGTNDAALARLDANTIAFIDDVNMDFRTYSWDGSDWTQIGNDLNITGVNDPALAALDSNTIAYIDTDNDDLRTYSWDGSDWSQVGNELNIPSGAGGAVGIAALNNITIAYSDNQLDDLRTYSWDGSDWTLVGNILPFQNAFDPAVARVRDNFIARYEQSAGNHIRTYRWDGTNWFAYGDDITITAAGDGAIAFMDSRTVAFIDEVNDDLRTYVFTQCTSPNRWEGTIIYNTTTNQMQYCDGKNWIAMGQAGDGGAGCANPIGTAGKLIFNNTYNILQYCEGDTWVKVRGDNKPSAPTSGLIGHWKLDEISYTSAADSSGNSFNGSLQGGVQRSPLMG